MDRIDIAWIGVADDIVQPSFASSVSSDPVTDSAVWERIGPEARIAVLVNVQRTVQEDTGRLLQLVETIIAITTTNRE